MVLSLVYGGLLGSLFLVATKTPLTTFSPQLPKARPKLDFCDKNILHTKMTMCYYLNNYTAN